MAKFNQLFLLASLVFGNAYADIRINEFMADNDTVLADDDGDFSDWIELHNTGSAVNLAGWYLTDDLSELTQWALPSIILPAGGYLIIYASDKDRVTGTFLHANFKLGKGGEYLALVQPDGVTVEYEYAPEYPQQEDDISYGVAASGDIGYLSDPTPAAANSELTLPSVSISPVSQLFTGTLTITLQTDLALATGDVIRYTTDGSDPLPTSIVYSAPFVLNEGAQVRAAVFRGAESSLAVISTYVHYAADLIGFESSLPLVVISTGGESVSTDDVVHTPTSIAVIDSDNATSSTSLSGDVDYVGYAGLRVRGSSSAAFPKRPYKVELWDADQDDFDVNILGLGEESDYVLIPPGNMDRNLISNTFMADLSSDMGMLSMDWRYVEVFLDDGDNTVSQDDYEGIYLLFENIKTGEQRVDIADLSPTDVAEPAISGGYIIKYDRVDPDEYSFTPGSAFSSVGDSNFQLVVHRPKLDDLSSAQSAWIEGYVRDFESALLGATALDAETGYRRHIEENSWIDAHILDVLALDADLLRLSNYFYKDRGYRLVNAPVWDFDRSLNSADERDDDPDQLHSPRQVDPFEYSWWGELFNIEHFDEKYRRRWHALREGPLSNAALFARVDELAAPLFEPYPREHERWGALPDYGSRYGGESNYQGEVDALKDWLWERVNFLDGFLSDPGNPDCSSSTLDYSLVADTWAMISLPCVPPASSTISSIFGDDIGGTYGVDWAVLIFDPAIGESGNYVSLTADELPEPGQGFWIIQLSESVAILDLPAGSTAVTSDSSIPACSSIEGCTSVPVSTVSRWMLLGNPLRTAVALESIRVLSNSGVCSGVNSCSLSAAASADILPSPMFTYFREASSSYRLLPSVGLLDEWSAFWMFAGDTAGAADSEIVFTLD